jgi:hypothetical protein
MFAVASDALVSHFQKLLQKERHINRGARTRVLKPRLPESSGVKPPPTWPGANDLAKVANKLKTSELPITILLLIQLAFLRILSSPFISSPFK